MPALAPAAPAMPAPPGPPPGGAGGSNKYPQYGVNQAGKVIVAHNETEKLADMNKGYLEWFSTQQAAKNWFNGQHLPNPLSGLAAIGDFFARLSEANTWIRVAEVLLGLGLLVVGVAKLVSDTKAGKAAARIATKAALV